jgi:hypothetical protein
MRNRNSERGNSTYAGKCNDNLNTIGGNIFVGIYYVLCKWSVYYISFHTVSQSVVLLVTVLILFILSFQDYSWDDHGYSLVNRLYNDVGNLLDEKFKTASNLTYYTMGGRKDVDTSRFRRAIWNYIQCMYGIR